MHGQHKGERFGASDRMGRVRSVFAMVDEGHSARGIALLSVVNVNQGLYKCRITKFLAITIFDFGKTCTFGLARVLISRPLENTEVFSGRFCMNVPPLQSATGVCGVYLLKLGENNLMRCCCLTINIHPTKYHTYAI